MEEPLEMNVLVVGEEMVGGEIDALLRIHVKLVAVEVFPDRSVWVIE